MTQSDIDKIPNGMTIDVLTDPTKWTTPPPPKPKTPAAAPPPTPEPVEE